MKHFFLITILCFGYFFCCVQPSSAFPLPDGLENAMHQIQDTAAAIKAFSLTLYDITSFFAKLMGFSAILLLLATLITSSGLVSVGVPPGRISFFTALAFWDGLWILWTVASAGLTGSFAGHFVLTNGKVLSPFVLFEVLRLGIPCLWKYFLRHFRRGVSRREAGSISRGYRTDLCLAAGFGCSRYRRGSEKSRLDGGEYFIRTEASSHMRSISPPAPVRMTVSLRIHRKILHRLTAERPVFFLLTSVLCANHSALVLFTGLLIRSCMCCSIVCIQ